MILKVVDTLSALFLIIIIALTLIYGLVLTVPAMLDGAAKLIEIARRIWGI